MPDRPPTPDERAAAADVLPVVLYDGACRFCVAQAERVRRLGRGAVQVRPLQEAAALVPWIDPDEAARALTLVDEEGRPVRGAGAVVELLARSRPALRPLRLLLRVPGVRSLAEAAYEAVAARRYALFGRTPDHVPCDGGACERAFGERAAATDEERALRR